MTDHKWLTAEEVAKEMRTKVNTVNEMARRGDLPATKFGRWWRFREDLFRDYLKRRTNPDPQERSELAKAQRGSGGSR